MRFWNENFFHSSLIHRRVLRFFLENAHNDIYQRNCLFPAWVSWRKLAISLALPTAGAELLFGFQLWSNLIYFDHPQIILQAQSVVRNHQSCFPKTEKWTLAVSLYVWVFVPVCALFLEYIMTMKSFLIPKLNIKWMHFFVAKTSS